jgi:hypothetical protein
MVFFPTPKNEDAAGNTLHKTDLSMLYIKEYEGSYIGKIP